MSQGQVGRGVHSKSPRRTRKGGGGTILGSELMFLESCGEDCALCSEGTREATALSWTLGGGI